MEYTNKIQSEEESTKLKDNLETTKKTGQPFF